MESISEVSVVIPVYAGEDTLSRLMDEILPLTTLQHSGGGLIYCVKEVILVHDCGPDLSHKTIQNLASQFSFVIPVWLTKNFGQHAATLAGLQVTASKWVVTMDEDGQQNPNEIKNMLDFAIEHAYQVVYGKPINPPPHGFVRNFFSKLAKKISSGILGNKGLGSFNSYRLIDGEVARTLASFCKNGVYLDVGLSWIVGRVGHYPLYVRGEWGRSSSYSYLKLMQHFWGLVLTTGTRPLRLITFVGILSIFLALGLSAYAIYGKYVGSIPVEGWTSLVIVVAFSSGTILASLGVISEYLAVTTSIAMGRPLFVISSSPQNYKN